MTKVYIWNADLGGVTSYSPPTRVRVTQQWDGAPGQKVEQTPRSTVTLEGEIVRNNAADFEIMMDRLDGGINLVGIWDLEWRKKAGWDVKPAIGSTGAEFWRADGNTSIYNGEAANPPTGPWRSVFAAAAGAASAGAASLAVDGLLASEVIPKGGMIRVGDYRHRLLAEATADGSGAATLSLAVPLRAAVANDAQVRVPGDFFVGRLIGQPQISGADVFGLRTFKLALIEVYEDELADATVSPTELFEYVVD